MYRWRTRDGYYYPNSAWRLGFIGGYQFEIDGARQLDAYSGFFFYATGVTPAMDSRIVGEGSQYMAAFVDSKGNVVTYETIQNSPVTVEYTTEGGTTVVRKVTQTAPTVQVVPVVPAVPAAPTIKTTTRTETQTR